MSRGFTLIELLVSTALFSVVLVLSVSALLVLVDANRKAQSLKSVTNNLNFGIDSVTRTIRTGHTFYCDDDVEDMPEGTQACPSGATGITFTADTGALVGYRLEGSMIERRTVDGSDDSGWIALTAPEVEIAELLFYVTGAEEDDGAQSTVTLAIRGEAGVDLDTDTTFNIQTTVAQRRLSETTVGTTTQSGSGSGTGRTVVIKAWGAGGGGDNANQGGAGGFTSATYDIEPGTSLYVWVGTGGAGSPRIGASGAGGSPGGGSTGSVGGGGGGGFSGVFTGSSLSQANALVIAGGGGGESNHNGSGPGGAGGGTNGEQAASSGGGGGTQSAGGAGAPDTGRGGGTAGSALQGGGGSGDDASGGGGGWYGGGAGADHGSSHSAGGGGSGYYRQASLPSAISFASGATYAGNYGTPPSQGTSDSDYPGGSVSYGGGNPGSNGYVVISVDGTKTTFSSGTGTSFTVN